MTVMVSGPADCVTAVVAGEQAASNNKARSRIRFIFSFIPYDGE
jgi:hypothetical protein